MSSLQKTPPEASPSTENEPDDSFVLTLPDDPASDKDWYLWAGVLALLVFVAFFPAVNGQYLWDDDHHAGLIQYFQTLGGLEKIWIPQEATPQYYPLTFTTFWIEHLLWADSTAGYHIDNMLLHAGSAVLVWRLLRRLKLPGAWLAAAIWAIHPIQTESVAWISERKNVLSGLLFFASIWFYLSFDDGPAKGKKSIIGKNGAYALSLLFFALALLAKTVACAMPAVILILAWWRGKKLLDRRTLMPLLPFFAAGILLGAVTVYLEASPNGNVGAHGADWNLSLVQRLLIAGRGVWFYVCKLILPLRLTFSYPRVMPVAMHWLYLAGAIAAGGILWVKRNVWGRGPMAAVLYYVVTLFPSLGFINIYPMRYSFVADHFQYLSGLGLIVLAVAAGAQAVKRIRLPAGATTTLSVAVVVALFCPTWIQAHVYQSTELLWRDVLAKNPNSWMADDNLGVELIKLGEDSEKEAASDRLEDQTDAAADADADSKAKFAEAEQRLRDALRQKESYTTHNALGLLYRHLGRWAEAEAELRSAVAIEDQDELAHRQIAPYVNYAQVYQHQYPEADIRTWLDKAMSLSAIPHTKPSDVAMAHLAYGDYWKAQAGAASKARKLDDERTDIKREIDHLLAAVAVVPTDIEALLKLGQAYQQLGLRDGENAKRERDAGRSEQADKDSYLSQQVDAHEALKYYMASIQQVPNGRFAPALAGIGTLYWRNETSHVMQAETVNDLISAVTFLTDALGIDPATPDAGHYLAQISQDLMTQAQLAREHESAWEPLRAKLQMLADGNVTKPGADDAIKAVRVALYPAAASHPLRGPLTNLLAAIAGFQSDVPPPDAARTVAEQAKAVLAAWNTRKPGDDVLNDMEEITLCYSGVVKADPHSAAAWRNLREIVDQLSAAVAGRPDLKGTPDALTAGRKVLDDYRAATQPAPSKVMGPATLPATAPAVMR